MSVSKKLGYFQIVIMVISIIISFYTYFGAGGSVYVAVSGWGASVDIWVYMVNTYIFPGVMFVTGVIQVLYAASHLDNSQKALGAGILGILSFIPFVKAVALVMNIFVVLENN